MLIITAGKGGVGKTTLIGALSRILQGQGAQFAVIDADPVGRLGQLLGAEDRPTVAQMVDANIGEVQLDTLLAPLSSGGALMRMGHHQHSGCFCRVNSLTRVILDNVLARFPLTLMDNEAGLEHVTRGLSAGATRLILVADESRAALEVARDTLETIRALKEAGQEHLRGTSHLVIRTNAVESSPRHDQLVQAAHELGLPRPRLIPNSPTIAYAQMSGSRLPTFGNGELLYQAVEQWAKADGILNGNSGGER